MQDSKSHFLRCEGVVDEDGGVVFYGEFVELISAGSDVTGGLAGEEIGGVDAVEAMSNRTRRLRGRGAKVASSFSSLPWQGLEETFIGQWRSPR